MQQPREKRNVSATGQLGGRTDQTGSLRPRRLIGRLTVRVFATSSGEEGFMYIGIGALTLIIIILLIIFVF